MLPIPTRFLFRSRWAALIWAVGICVSAAQFARDKDDDRDPAGTLGNDAAQPSATPAVD